MIKLEDCKHRVVYRVQARNFSFAAFDEHTQQLIGIREKFGHKDLFGESHIENSGTAAPIEAVEELPEYFHIWEKYPGIMCLFCGEDVEFIHSTKLWAHKKQVPCTQNQAAPKSTYWPLYYALDAIEKENQDGTQAK